jgi:hypothetical protein
VVGKGRTREVPRAYSRRMLGRVVSLHLFAWGHRKDPGCLCINRWADGNTEGCGGADTPWGLGSGRRGAPAVV